jgi:NitT/TauT family transport system permease protein
MMTDVPQRRAGAAGGTTFPVSVVTLVALVLWYALAVVLNAPQVRDRAGDEARTLPLSELARRCWSMERPVLPAPHQIAQDLRESILETDFASKRSLVYHAAVTVSATLPGFAFGAVLGALLAIGIVRSPALDRGLLPWLIASQTIPILAIAPMVVVVLGSVGLTGLLPKAIISAYLCFFPVAVGMVKGLRSPEPLQIDLMHTYSATPRDVLLKLRLPASTPFLFASLKVAIAASLVGAIVGELPTGAQAGLGARLLSGSYFGQTVQIWSALIVASLVGLLLVGAVGGVESWTRNRRGGAA